jgi:hypothetical protein
MKKSLILLSALSLFLASCASKPEAKEEMPQELPSIAEIAVADGRFETLGRRPRRRWFGRDPQLRVAPLPSWPPQMTPSPNSPKGQSKVS